MAKKKGLLQDFDLLGDEDKPDAPVHVGDYLEESARTSPKTAEQPRRRKKKPPVAKDAEKKAARVEASAATAVAAVPSTSGRTRLNITEEQRDKLDEIVQEMKRVGPERHLKASEVVDALVSVLHDAREHLDMSMVRRRGKFGTQQHRMYRDALAESVRLTIAKHHGE